MGKVWFLGEALIDFVPAGGGEPAYAPRPGGSPLNAAVATARQGAEVGFLGGISTDLFGDQMAAYLADENIDISRAERSDNPSTLAFVDIQKGEPRYAFFNRMSATQLVTPDPAFAPRPGDILHTGSIALIDTPGADNIRDFCLTHAGAAFLSVDANARPGMTADPDDWRARVGALHARAGLVKLSREDLEFLAPGSAPTDFAQRMLNGGAALVVITSGESGAEAFNRTAHVTAPARRPEMVDTVGAGDVVTGTLLAALAQTGDPKALGADDLRKLLVRAMTAASLNCERSGCNPPTTAEIDSAA